MRTNVPATLAFTLTPQQQNPQNQSPYFHVFGKLPSPVAQFVGKMGFHPIFRGFDPLSVAYLIHGHLQLSY